MKLRKNKCYTSNKVIRIEANFLIPDSIFYSKYTDVFILKIQLYPGAQAPQVLIFVVVVCQ